MALVKHRIFVSHSHLDNDLGTRLVQDLRRVLVDADAVFYDVLGGLHGGDTWWEKIVEELTARDVFLLVLSPEAMNSMWVRREINMAFNENKNIIPLYYRACTIRADLKILEMISFLAPKPYETAFQEVLSALGLPQEPPGAQTKRGSHPPERPDPTASLIQQMETAFAEHDWPDVIRKASYLIRHDAGTVSSQVYRLQGLAWVEEGELQQAQEALETALALVGDRNQRLTLLSDYTALLARQDQWQKVLHQAREALRFLPNDPGWLATQQQAQSQLTKAAPVSSPSPKKTPTQESRVQPAVPALQKSKEQWTNEGISLHNLKQYEEALTAYEQAVRLDPNDADAYNGKGISLYNLRRYEEALTAYDQAIHLDPNDAVAYHNKGFALEQLGKQREAQQAHTRAKQLGYNN